MQIIHAGEAISCSPTTNVIALLGPVPLSAETSHLNWHTQAISALFVAGYNGLVLVPNTRGELYYDMSKVQDPDHHAKEMQWNGEMFKAVKSASYLKNGVFAFWIPRGEDMQAKYTEQEFYDLVPKHPTATVMGIPPTAVDVDDMQTFCSDQGLVVHQSMEDWAKAIVEKLS